LSKSAAANSFGAPAGLIISSSLIVAAPGPRSPFGDRRASNSVDTGVLREDGVIEFGTFKKHLSDIRNE
jgi:hypothetical protein